MSDFEHKEGYFSLFKNNFKEKPEHPDLKGQGMYKGEIVDVSGWKKKTKSGDVYISGMIQKPWEKKKDIFDKDADIPF